jgi:Ran GTPase-activating protein (RanGAP) involved in mRNA processing and transport
MSRFRVICPSGEKAEESSNVPVDGLLQFIVSHRLSPLTSLRLADGVMAEFEMSLLCAIIPTNLRVLDLSNLGLTCSCINTLMKRLVRSRIRRLNLSHNPMGDGGAWLLLEFIKQNAELVALSIAYCDLTAGGVWPICVAMALRTFDFLDISGNRIKSFGAEHVRDLLAASPKLREIHIDDMQMSPGDVEMLVQAARKCHNTEIISIKGNRRISYQVLPPIVLVDMLPEMT